MLPIIFPILMLIGIVLIVISCKRNSNDIDGYGVLGVSMTTFFMVCTLIWPFIYVPSITDVADLEVFYQKNLSNYRITIDNTREAIIILNKESILSAENFQQSTNLSERIKELRDEIVDYNYLLNRLRVYNDNSMLFLFYANVPEDLKQIMIE